MEWFLNTQDEGLVLRRPDREPNSPGDCSEISYTDFES